MKLGDFKSQGGQITLSMSGDYTKLRQELQQRVEAKELTQELADKTFTSRVLSDARAGLRKVEEELAVDPAAEAAKLRAKADALEATPPAIKCLCTKE